MKAAVTRDEAINQLPDEHEALVKDAERYRKWMTMECVVNGRTPYQIATWVDGLPAAPKAHQ